ncbi:MAG: hypothetical protein GXY05_05815 [Clostridiales bacterium]|nr:hypothetical protein [Clostridiales bacterium]
MRRNDFVLKVMSAVLFLAIAAYIGLYIFDKANKSLVTAAAVRYTEEDSCSADGYIVRSETILPGGGGTITLLAREGEKLASGQAVAVHYEGESALERASEIYALQLEIKEAEEAVDLTDEQRRADAEACVFTLSEAVQRQEFSSLEDLALGIEKTIFTSSVKKTTDAELAVLRDRLAGLLRENDGTSTVYSPISGIFSYAVDGSEHLGPEKLTDLTPASLEALFAFPQNTGTDVLGKLITGITWYYAAVMDKSDADKLQGIVDGANDGRLSGGPVATLKFAKEYNAKLDMRIVSIGAEENGKCVVVFSAKRGISDMTALRRLTAQVEFGSTTGLLIPKEAVYHETAETGNKTYIFLLTGLQAEKVYIDILSEIGENYIVKDGTENGTVLREGSSVIIKANDLYDGKVVGR